MSQKSQKSKEKEIKELKKGELDPYPQYEVGEWVNEEGFYKTDEKGSA